VGIPSLTLTLTLTLMLTPRKARPKPGLMASPAGFEPLLPA
jgi:hypothetical protein